MDDAQQIAAIKTWQYESKHGQSSRALRATIRRHAKIDAYQASPRSLPLFDQPAREKPSLLEVIDALEQGSIYDSIELDAIAAAYEAYPQAVGALFEAIRYRMLGFPLPPSLKQQLRRERMRTGLALSLTSL